MSVLIDNLRRRENWPSEFISALKKCEQRDLADRISKDYDRIRGIASKSVSVLNLQLSTLIKSTFFNQQNCDSFFIYYKFCFLQLFLLVFL